MFPVYASAIKTFSVYLAPVYFALFLITVIIRKTASKTDAYTQSNRMHFYIGTLYAITLTVLAIYFNQVNSDFCIGILTGLYIYFSLHYVFIFPMIGICKKSISISIMESLCHIESTGVPYSNENLESQMRHQNVSIDHIRQSRLEQMVLLKFATYQGKQFQITMLGQKIHELGEIILAIWNQKRL